MTFTKIPLDSKNRMFTPFRVGFNDERLFIRIDLWWVGFRIGFGG